MTEEKERAMNRSSISNQATSFPTEAIEALRSYQQQLDEEGIMVGVSRQAVDEVLAYLAMQSASPQLQSTEAVERVIREAFDEGAKYFQNFNSGPDHSAGWGSELPWKNQSSIKDVVAGLVNKFKQPTKMCIHGYTGVRCDDCYAAITALTSPAVVEAPHADEVERLRAERDALLQKPIDLAKMDSVDEDATDRMIAYYWWQQAQEARAALLVTDKTGVERYREALEKIASCHSHHPDDVVAIARTVLNTPANKEEGNS